MIANNEYMDDDSIYYSIRQTTDDKELDCMNCLNQVIDIFKDDLEEHELNRVSRWFNDKYGYKEPLVIKDNN